MSNVQGLWLKTHIERRGHMLVATTGIIDGSLHSRLFEVRVDLRPIARAVMAYHKQELHQNRISGCVGCGTSIGFLGIGKAIKKLGRNKLVRKVAKVATYSNPITAQVALANKARKSKKTRKAIVKAATYSNLITAAHAVAMNPRVKRAAKNRGLGAAVGTVAVAFPPIGTPALAAYAGANAALAAAENGKRAAGYIKGLVKKSKQLTKIKRQLKAKNASPAMVRLTARNPKIRAKIRAAIAARRKLKKIRKNKSWLAKIVQQRNLAQKKMQQISAAAKYSTDPKKRAEAQKAAAVILAAANARARIKAIEQRMSPEAKAGQTGILVTNKGPVKGRFVKVATSLGTTPDLLMLPGRSELGEYERVSGCIGCGLFNY